MAHLRHPGRDAPLGIAFRDGPPVALMYWSDHSAAPSGRSGARALCRPPRTARGGRRSTTTVSPAALENSTGLAAARESGLFTPVHDAFWAAAREARGRAEGTRALIDVLLLHRRLPGEAVVAGMNAVLQAGSVSPDLVAIEARKAVAAGGGPPPVVTTPPSNATAAEDGPEDQDTVSAQVISLPARRPELPPDTRPEPSLAAYGQLLSIQPKGSA
ncbi:hypothetical protein [Streptomyces roseoviridis]|uniref:hypothetical protein n=1 Tax=Streptomyces roseoviridis TaxID=67361 RepID=UPI0031EC8AA2